jgi:hypothetical protein
MPLSAPANLPTYLTPDEILERKKLKEIILNAFKNGRRLEDSDLRGFTIEIGKKPIPETWLFEGLNFGKK